MWLKKKEEENYTTRHVTLDGTCWCTLQSENHQFFFMPLIFSSNSKPCLKAPCYSSPENRIFSPLFAASRTKCIVSASCWNMFSFETSTCLEGEKSRRTKQRHGGGCCHDTAGVAALCDITKTFCFSTRFENGGTFHFSALQAQITDQIQNLQIIHISNAIGRLKVRG